MKLVKLKCESCGAQLSLESGMDTYFCPYCGTKFRLHDESKLKVSVDYNDYILQKLNNIKKFEQIGDNPVEQVNELLKIEPLNFHCLEYLLDYEIKITNKIIDIINKKGTAKTSDGIIINNYFVGDYRFGIITSNDAGKVFSKELFKKNFIDDFFAISRFKRNIKAANDGQLNQKLKTIKKLRMQICNDALERALKLIRKHNEPTIKVTKYKISYIVFILLTIAEATLSLIISIKNESFKLFAIGFILFTVLGVITSVLKNRYYDAEDYNNNLPIKIVS